MGLGKPGAESRPVCVRSAGIVLAPGPRGPPSAPVGRGSRAGLLSCGRAGCPHPGLPHDGEAGLSRGQLWWEAAKTKFSQ